MDEGRAILAAQPEVLSTYPSQMGDYDKIRRPSLQDGVGRLTRFSPRDYPVQLSSSTSVTIQLPRPDSELLASPGWALTAVSGSLRSRIVHQLWGIQRHSPPRAHSDGTEWSDALERNRVRCSLHSVGVPGRYGLRCTSSWCDLMVCLFVHQCPTSCRG